MMVGVSQFHPSLMSLENIECGHQESTGINTTAIESNYFKKIDGVQILLYCLYIEDTPDWY